VPFEPSRPYTEFRMVKLRKPFFWIHLVVGLAVGVAVLSMSVTGVVLVLAPQITAFAERRVATENVTPRGSRLNPQELLDRAAKQNIEANAVTIYADRSRAAEVYTDDGIILVSADTGRMLGKPDLALRNFFKAITRWHRQFAFAGQSRATGRAITHAANLALLFLAAVGIYLWWPRRWTLRYLRSVAWFRTDVKAKARDFNWHNTAGVWCLIPLSIISFTGVLMSYQWANRVLYRVTGSPMAVAEAGDDSKQDEEETAAPPSGEAIPLDKLWSTAESRVVDWKSIYFEVPDATDAEIGFRIDASDGGRPDQRSTLTLDRYSGSVTGWDNFAGQSAARKVRLLGRYAHTGQLGGLPGQIVAGIASLFCVLLVWTGGSLSLHRLRAARARSRRKPKTVPVGTPPGIDKRPAPRERELIPTV